MCYTKASNQPRLQGKSLDGNNIARDEGLFWVVHNVWDDESAQILDILVQRPISLGNAAVQRVFSLKRYSKLTKYLHLSDREAEKPNGHPQYNKLGKVHWLLEHLLNKTSNTSILKRIRQLMKI